MPTTPPTTPPDDPAAFIRSRLHLAAVPDCPGIRLYAPDARSGLGRLAGPPPYWAYAWAGGAALAQHLARHPDLVAGRRVLDFGAGSGLLAILAAGAGARAALAADLDSMARAAIALNAEANGTAVQILDADLAAPGAPLPDVEIVLAGDVFYLPRVARRVLPFLERCAAAGKTVLVGDPYRRPLPRARLHRIAEYEVTDMGQADHQKTRAAVFSLVPQELGRAPGCGGKRANDAGRLPSGKPPLAAIPNHLDTSRPTPPEIRHRPAALRR